MIPGPLGPLNLTWRCHGHYNGLLSLALVFYLSRAGLERVDRGRIDDDMESKEGRPYGRDEDLCRWAAAAAPEPGPIGLVVEDHGRSVIQGAQTYEACSGRTPAKTHA